MRSTGSPIGVSASSIEMQAAASTFSGGGNITYIANLGNALLSVLDAGNGQALVIAANDVYRSQGLNATTDNIIASLVEVRAGGLAGGTGQIGTNVNELNISTPSGDSRLVFLIVPTVNGIQTSTPQINYNGPISSLLLKGYTGTSGALLFDPSNAFTTETVLGSGESIVPLLNGRIAVNTDSLGAAKQALSSGVVVRVNVDWAAFDPDVRLFGTLDPALRLPNDQIDEPEEAAN
jgi:hypothetical protein